MHAADKELSEVHAVLLGNTMISHVGGRPPIEWGTFAHIKPARCIKYGVP